MSHYLYLLRRPNPYHLEEVWYYSKVRLMKWTNDVTQATFLSLEKAEELGLQVLEKTDVACELLGPYV